MPELPEVETIARELDQVLPGVRVTNVLVRLPKLVKVPLPRFRRQVVGARVRRVHRRAKLLLVELSRSVTLVIHLKMSGQLIWQPKRGEMRVGGHPTPGGLDRLPNRYTHVVFSTNRGTLFFNDQRQFGFMRLVPTDQLETWLAGQGYGPEPLNEEFTEMLFHRIMRRVARRRVKTALLDQHVVAGIGNIYADEACFAARLRPTRGVGSLSTGERRALFRSIRHVLTLSLRHGGTSTDSYRRADGRKGAMLPFLRVYGRAGLSCRRGDGGVIRKIVLQGRGTHFCPICQR